MSQGTIGDDPRVIRLEQLVDTFMGQVRHVRKMADRTYQQLADGGTESAEAGWRRIA